MVAATSSASDFNKVFGRRLNERAMELGMTGAKVARLAGINPKSFNNYINGERQPDTETLRAIAVALETSVDTLISAKPMLENRDSPTFLATQRITAACLNLTGEDMGFLAAIADAIHWRRRDERRKLPSIQSELVRVHELLLPAILYDCLPISLDTLQVGHQDESRWLNIELTFPKNVDANVVPEPLVRLAYEVLDKNPDTELEATASDQATFTSATLRVFLGT